MRDARSPDVGAEKAPPVKPSSGCASLDLAWTGLAALALGATKASGLEDLNMLDSGERSIKNKNSQFKKHLPQAGFGGHTSSGSRSDEWGAEMREAIIFADLQGQ